MSRLKACGTRLCYLLRANLSRGPSRNRRYASGHALLALNVLLGVLCVLNTAQASDVTIQPSLGSGFVIKSVSSDRFRVQENGQVTIPALPQAAAQLLGVCMSGAGVLGTCATNGGSSSAYTAGTGLALNGTVFAIAAPYQLPQNCAIDQIIKWSGSVWACASSAAAGGIPSCDAGQLLRFSAGGLQCFTPPPTMTLVVESAKYSSITMGADGFPLVSYYSERGRALGVVNCLDAACTRSQTTTLDSSAQIGLGAGNSIAVDKDGLPVVAYYDGVAGDLKLFRCKNDRCPLSSSTEKTLDTGGDVGARPTVRVSRNGAIAVAYEDRTNGQVKLTTCGDSTCSGGGFVQTTVSIGAGKNPALAMDANGLPVIAYFSDTGAVILQRCSNPLCTLISTPVTLATPARTLGGISLMMGADGFPLVTYSGGQTVTQTTPVPTAEINVARCADASCSAGGVSVTLIKEVTQDERIGEYLATAIGIDGRPIITFEHEGRGFDYLGIIRCGDAACRSGNVETIADNRAPGSFNSVAIGADGVPIVSYTGVVPNPQSPGGFTVGLKIYQCADATCKY
jgi:hypothetical protein